MDFLLIAKHWLFIFQFIKQGNFPTLNKSHYLVIYIQINKELQYGEFHGVQSKKTKQNTIPELHSEGLAFN